MKLTNVISVKDFQKAIDMTQGSVWIESIEGDKFNLKSSLSQYIAIGRLIEDKGADLELYCSNPADESLFYKFFSTYPECM